MVALEPDRLLIAEPVWMQCPARTAAAAGVIGPEEIAKGRIARILPRVSPVW